MKCAAGRLGGVILFACLIAPLSGQSTSAEKDAKAILDAKCVICHGQTRMSDLDLRAQSSILHGGKRGPSVVPGNADASLLYKAIKREGELQMPPGKSVLTPKEVAILRDWINAGARLGSAEGPTPTPAPSWWSFRKPARPPVPTPKDVSRVRNSIDNFILAKLDQQGLKPAGPADRRT